MAQSVKDRQKSVERALEDAVSRALRDNLAPLQRTAEELQQAYADLVAACSSTRPANALPAMLRAQTSASALAAGLSVLSNFVTLALNPRDHHATAADTADTEEYDAATATATEEDLAPPAATTHSQVESDLTERSSRKPAASGNGSHPQPAPVAEKTQEKVHAHVHEAVPEPVEEEPVAAEETEGARAEVFDLASLPPEVQDLHRRANRVAKVAMQDIKLLRPKDVRLGCEHKDICHRLRSDLDKARKEYDRRFRTILDDPVDYFHHWMVQVLAEGDPSALGEYPYPSPVGRSA
ncbi:MAG TPA: hypothetical protein VMF66_16290 [Candidatus Acidoferrum sp.]|nr:hypothetical protein [Candidatus Acidoferrum sp.]